MAKVYIIDKCWHGERSVSIVEAELVSKDDKNAIVKINDNERNVKVTNVYETFADAYDMFEHISQQMFGGKRNG